MSISVDKAVASLLGKGFTLEEERVLNLFYDGRPAVRIFLREKYAQFQGELTQSATDVPVFEELLKALESEGFSVNLD